MGVFPDVARCMQHMIMPPDGLRDLYVQTVRDALTGVLAETPDLDGQAYNATVRAQGLESCSGCLTLIGTNGLQHTGELLLNAWRHGVCGDFLEAGVWKGGVGIYMAALSRAYLADGGPDRWVVLADSFAGLPRSSSRVSGTMEWSKLDWLNGGTRGDVEAAFRRFGLLSDSVQFVEGNFVETLPRVREKYLATGRRLAMLRLDGDMYESCMDVLYNLYDLVSVGGYVICDDCRGLLESDRALGAFMQQQQISELLQRVPGRPDSGLWWRKEREVPSAISEAGRASYADWVYTRAARLATKDCYVGGFLERLALLRLEVPMAASESDLHRSCPQAENLVLVWVAPFGITFEDITLQHDELIGAVTWMFNMHDALSPVGPLGGAEYCACTVGVDSWLNNDAVRLVRRAAGPGALTDVHFPERSVYVGLFVLRGNAAKDARAALAEPNVSNAIFGGVNRDVIREWATRGCPDWRKRNFYAL